MRSKNTLISFPNNRWFTGGIYWLRMNKLLYALLFFVLIGGLWYAYAQQSGVSFSEFFLSSENVIKVGGVPMRVDVANTAESRQLGLSGRQDIGSVVGLLMVFDEPGYHGIWMKGMRFPIDVIWISEDFRVVGITRNLTPESYPKIFEPPEPIRYVLETNISFADVYGISTGDTADIPESLQ